jgi:hypothetical protein
MRFLHLLAILLVLASVVVAQSVGQVPPSTEKASSEKSATSWSNLPPKARRAILDALQKDNAPDWSQQAELTAADGAADDLSFANTRSPR